MSSELIDEEGELSDKYRAARKEQMDAFMFMITKSSQILRKRYETESELLKSKESAVRNSWAQVMRVAKTEELQSLVSVLSADFDRAVDNAQRKLRISLDDCSADEEHARHIARIHALSLDRLLRHAEDRSRDVRSEMLEELRSIKREHEAERDGLVARHASLRVELLHQLRVLKEDEERKVTAMDAEFGTTREALRRRSLERIHALQTDMDSVIEILEKAFEEAHQRYFKETDQRTQDFKSLSARGQHDTQLKERQRRAIKRLQDLLSFQQNRLGYMLREEEQKNARLSSERDLVARQLTDLKAQMVSLKARSLARMKTLVAATTKTTATNAENVALATRILSAATTARALEPESIKVAPFATAFFKHISDDNAAAGGAEAAASGDHSDDGTASLSALTLRGATSRVAPSSSAVSSSAATTAASMSLEAFTEEPEALGAFYRRFNEALAQALALEEKRALLAEENRQLKAAVEACVRNTTLAADTLDGANTLVVINGKMAEAQVSGGATRRPPMQPKLVAVVSGAGTGALR